ncbi:MAG: pilus assembly protein [Erythrobacter sp.]|nr:pilus assembly protein [Erythrobacter sp.]
MIHAHPTIASWKRLLRRLLDDRSGATLTEFAFVGPVLIVMIMGIFDMAHTQYTSALINGALQKAGRDMTLENAASRISVTDARVRTQVLNVAPNGAVVEFERLSHFDFSDIGEAEEVIEPAATANQRCDPGETFIDANGNGAWDSDRGADGIGGARDAVLYTAIVTYPRLFPMYELIGLSENVTLRASTVLRNQPFDEQNRSTTTEDC